MADVTATERNVTALSLAVGHEGGKAPLSRLNITQKHHVSTLPHFPPTIIFPSPA